MRLCVAGFRWHKKGERTAIGSLLLGLHDDAGGLHHVGVCASLQIRSVLNSLNSLNPIERTRLRRIHGKNGPPLNSKAIAFRVRKAAGVTARTCRGSRCVLNSWLKWRDHMQGSRFRHTAQFRRWRTDKKPTGCTFAQLEVVPPHELETIFATKRLKALNRNHSRTRNHTSGPKQERGFILRPFVLFCGATHAWDHRRGRVFPGAGEVFPERCGGSRECVSRLRNGLALNQPVRRLPRAT